MFSLGDCVLKRLFCAQRLWILNLFSADTELWASRFEWLKDYNFWTFQMLFISSQNPRENNFKNNAKNWSVITIERFLIQNFANYQTMAGIRKIKTSDRTWKSRVDFLKFVFIGSRLRQGWHSPFKLPSATSAIVHTKLNYRATYNRKKIRIK